MTLTTSSNKINPALNMFLFTLRKNFGLTAIASVLALLISPFLVLSIINQYFDANPTSLIYSLSEDFYAFAAVLAVGACIFMIVLTLINFNFLYKKNASDAFHSMPLTRNELLLSRFFANYICSIIPVFLSFLGFFFIGLSPRITLDFGVLASSFLYFAFMLLFCSAFTAIFAVCAGSAFDAVASFTVFNIGLPIIFIIINEQCANYVGWYPSNDIIFGYSSTLKYTNPFLYSIYRFASSMASEEQQLFSVGFCIVIALLTVTLLAISCLLYNKRKSESAGQAFAFLLMPMLIGFIISVLGCYALSYIFSFDSFGNNIITLWGVVGAFIGSVLYSAITNRGFKKFKSGIIIAIASLLTVTAVSAAIKLDITGFEKYVPKESEIKSSVITYRGMDVEVANPHTTTALHNAIVSNLDEDSDYNRLIIKYNLKNGKTVTRLYYKGYAGTDAMNQFIAGDFAQEIKNEFDEFNGHTFDLTYFDHSTEKSMYASVDRETATRIVLAYVERLKNSPESLNNSRNTSADTEKISLSISSHLAKTSVPDNDPNSPKSESVLITEYDNYHLNILVNRGDKIEKILSEIEFKNEEESDHEEIYD